jgi:hypothetical protein
MAQTGPPGTGGGETEAESSDGLFLHTPSPEWIQEHLFGGPREKGPKPLMKKPVFKGEGGSGAAADAGSGGRSGGGSGGRSQPDDVPADWTPIGQPRPQDHRWYGGRDDMGGVIHGLSPLQPRPDTAPPDGMEPE